MDYQESKSKQIIREGITVVFTQIFQEQLKEKYRSLQNPYAAVVDYEPSEIENKIANSMAVKIYDNLKSKGLIK